LLHGHYELAARKKTDSNWQQQFALEQLNLREWPAYCPLLFMFVYVPFQQLAIWLLTRHINKHELN
jgi:hypothetical protein